VNDKDLQQRIEAVRRFNRFYTNQIGVLHEGLLRSPFTLTEARIIYELANRGESTATQLCHELRLKQAKTDGRQSLLRLTDRGEEAFAMLNSRSRNEIGAMLGLLSREDQYRLVSAMHTIEILLGANPEQRTPYLLRPHQPGDMGWVVHRHGVLYAEEYGWDETFEALVARVVAEFVDTFDPKTERCWIAEKDGEVVGSVFVVRKSKEMAKLRLLLVEPKARGLGIGTRLVDECVRFARRVGYRKLTLWTNSVLDAARHIYENVGFHLVHEEPHHSFGHDLVGETWELELRPSGR
jgi:GNAT superfamily N-acetyltransferase